MATYPIKILKDENGTPFVPLISLDSVQDTEGQSINEILDKKLETTNLIAGTQIELEVDGNNITISNSAEGTKLINNLETTQAGVGALDAHQGKVLLEKIPTIANNLSTPESGQALSAYQGYVLAGRVAPTGGAEGQVLKKASTDDYDFEWGDAADPNAIVGDGSIMKIVELSYEEYLELEAANQLQDDTEYHINNWTESGHSEITAAQVSTTEGHNVQEKLNNIDLIDEGQNTRLDVVEDNIDVLVDTVNDILQRKRVDTEYLGENPDIDLYHNGPGIYGIYNCSKAPSMGIGILEVLYYSYDWAVQRFTAIDHDGGAPQMWERCFYSGTTWTNWIKRW